MVIWHNKKGRKISCGLYHKSRDKRKSELGRASALTKVDEKDSVKTIKCRGNTEKIRALRLSTANVFDPVSKKFQKAKIKSVVENQSSRHYARMKVMTKGAIIDTSAGKAKITNRPGQEGVINAVKLA